MSKKNIYVVCKKCGKRVRIQLDQDLKFSREDHLLTIVHAHGELGENAHAIIVEMDRNFNIRSSRVSDEFFITFDI